jgi:hypothetical protein
MKLCLGIILVLYAGTPLMLGSYCGWKDETSHSALFSLVLTTSCYAAVVAGGLLIGRELK